MAAASRSAAALILLFLARPARPRILDVAVCVSGTPRNQGRPLRSDRPRWAIPPANEVAFRDFAREIDRGNVTGADTVHRFLYPSLGSFDVFMYVPTRTGGAVGRERAERACAHFAPRGPRGGRIFCSGGPDVLINSSVLEITPEDILWLNQRSWWPIGKLLQQIWGYTLCKTMIRDAEQLRRVRYRYILRLRPDLAFYAPFPSSDFRLLDPYVILGDGDMINLGLADTMHEYLDQIWDMRRIVRALRRRGRGFVGDHFALTWIEDVFGGRQVLWRNGTAPHYSFCIPYRQEKERWQGPYRFPTTPDFRLPPRASRAAVRWRPPRFKSCRSRRLLVSSREQRRVSRVTPDCMYCHMAVAT